MKKLALLVLVFIAALAASAEAQTIGPPTTAAGCTTNCTFTGTTTLGTGPAIITSPSAAVTQLGAADAASPVAQTLGVQNVVTGTSNTAGANLSIDGSQGTGTGAGGSILFKTSPVGSSGSTPNALVSQVSISASGWTQTNGMLSIGTLGSASQIDTTGGGNPVLRLAAASDGVALTRGDGRGTGFNFYALSYQATSGGGFYFNSGTDPYGGGTDTQITRGAAATIQLGAADAAAPVAQGLRAQSVVAGTSNTAGVNWTITGSKSTGTGVGGSIIQSVAKTGTTGSTVNSAFPLLTLNAGGATTATVQFGDGTNFTTYDSCTALTTGATGIVACTASASRFKIPDAALTAARAGEGLDKLHPASWTYKPEYQKQFGSAGETRVSLYADDVEKMDKRCVTYDHGELKDYSDRCVIAYLVADRQEMRAEINDLKRKLAGH